MRPDATIEIVREMACNRDRLDEAVAALRRDAALPARTFQRLVREEWVAAMRRHYALLDAYLAQRARERRVGVRRSVVIHNSELRAPTRPAEVPESIRPNLVLDIGGEGHLRGSQVSGVHSAQIVQRTS